MTTRLAIIIGAMKAGTTTLFQRLGEHPQILPACQKEPGFFSLDTAWERGLPWYLDLWPEPEEGQVLLEASTTYSKRPRHPATVDRMARTAEEHDLELSLIYSLRDPIARIESQLTHLVAGGKLDDQLVNFRRGSLDANSLCISAYAHQLDAYTRTFDREQIHLLAFEDLVADPAQVLDGITAFLGLDPHTFPEPKTVHNPTLGKYEKGSAWRLAEAFGLDKLTRLLPGRARTSLREALGARIEEKLELNPAQREAALHLLARDLKRLEEVYGFDLGGWDLL